jgi:hypothetical protein
LSRDLDTAQRLSLIGRHLEAAQLNIDSATELLGIVLQGGLGREVPAFDQVPAPGRKPRASRTKVGPTALLEEFIAAHPGEFKIDDVATWAKGKGYLINKASVVQRLYVMAKRKEGLVSVEKGSGRYKRAA